MEPQYYNWTCSVCSITWVLNSIGIGATREEVGLTLGYPDCVNETYGLMSSDCMIECFRKYSLYAREVWVSFDEAYSICEKYTGCISPQGMYHWMAIRGVMNYGLWLANSAPGYKGVWDYLSRELFNTYSPTKVIYVESYI